MPRIRLQIKAHRPRSGGRTSRGAEAPRARRRRSPPWVLRRDGAVRVHEGNAGEALAVLEAVAHQRLLELEAALCRLIGLQRDCSDAEVS